MNKYIYLFFCITCIVYGIYLFSLHLFLGDLLFHTDIARDFLLMQDIASNHRLTLIGLRAGGIPGVFFGPIWLYLNLPAFILGHGDPIVVGYFWVLLFLLSLVIVFYIAKKIFSVAVSIISITIFIYTIISLAPGYTQSFASILVGPLLLFLVFQFIENKSIRYLSWAIIICGLAIQLQPAFGSIITFITFVLSCIILWKRKQKRFFLIWFLILIPLSTYILFELKHNFLETQAVYHFIFHHNSGMFKQISFVDILLNRFNSFLASINLINIYNPFINLFFVLLNGFIVYAWYTSKKSHPRTFILLIYGYFISFWLVTFLFKGNVVAYYYWGFFPLLSIAVASLFLKINKGIYLILFSLLTLVMVKNGISTVSQWENNIYGKDTSSWIVNKEVAEYIYLDASEDFGYYVYSTNKFGYSKRYAMGYIGNTGLFQETGTVCTKKHLTYLIYNPTGEGAVTNPVFWKNAEVNIKAKPVWAKMIRGIEIEKYILTPNEIKMPSDPYMLCGIEQR